MILLSACGTAKHMETSKEPTILKPIQFLQSEIVQLSAPLLEVDSVLFRNSSTLYLKQSEPGTQIYYTVDMSEPDSNSLKYEGSILLKQSALIKAKAMHDDFKSSATISQQITKLNEAIEVENITLNPNPNEAYPGNGVESLHDFKTGSLNFRANNAWLGFQDPKIEVKVQLKRAHPIKKISFRFLNDQNSWIFLPKKLEAREDGKMISAQEFSTSESSPSKIHYFSLPLQNKKMKSFSVMIYTLETIPEWHPGKETAPWLFIDEMIIE